MVEDATDIEFHSTAYTALVENGTYFNVKDEGNFAWDTFTECDLALTSLA
jgi:hypothetical protein